MFILPIENGVEVWEGEVVATLTHQPSTRKIGREIALFLVSTDEDGEVSTHRLTVPSEETSLLLAQYRKSGSVRVADYLQEKMGIDLLEDHADPEIKLEKDCAVIAIPISLSGENDGWEAEELPDACRCVTPDYCQCDYPGGGEALNHAIRKNYRITDLAPDRVWLVIRVEASLLPVKKPVLVRQKVPTKVHVSFADEEIDLDFWIWKRPFHRLGVASDSPVTPLN